LLHKHIIIIFFLFKQNTSLFMQLIIYNHQLCQKIYKHQIYSITGNRKWFKNSWVGRSCCSLGFRLSRVSFRLNVFFYWLLIYFVCFLVTNCFLLWYHLLFSHNNNSFPSLLFLLCHQIPNNLSTFNLYRYKSLYV